MSKALQYGPQLTLASLLELQSKGTSRQINCHQVGEIVSFDPATQTAEVQVKMSFLLNGEIKEYPLLLDCPCIILAGGQGSVTFPIQAGDSCLVLFNDRDMDNWYSSGQTMPPRTDRLHDFSDAIALVGLRNKQNQISGYFADGVEIKHGNSSIKLKDGYIDIKGNVNVVQNTVDDNSLHAYIISSWHQGTEWRRVWSDGWCEQGGKVELVYKQNAYTDFPINLYKQMADTNYSILLTSSDRGNVHRSNWVYSTLTTSNFVTRTYSEGAGTGTGFWRVSGYIAQ